MSQMAAKRCPTAHAYVKSDSAARIASLSNTSFIDERAYKEKFPTNSSCCTTIPCAVSGNLAGNVCLEECLLDVPPVSRAVSGSGHTVGTVTMAKLDKVSDVEAMRPLAYLVVGIHGAGAADLQALRRPSTKQRQNVCAPS